jgi:photosystem II stability/assembly factor-like uncharacterized protein
VVEARHVEVEPGDLVLLVGTMKGAFLFRSEASWARWERAGPFFPGHAVYALAQDTREGRSRLWAAPESSHWGASLHLSDDFGRTWTEKPGAVRFEKETGASLRRIWQIAPAPGDPQRLYCGVEPAALFESRDGGETWALMSGLWDHPHRPQWEPGNGGLCLHTVLPPLDGGPFYVAISTGGVYRSDDGGGSWRTAHKGVRAEFLPDKHPEFGQCVHKIARHPSRPDRLFLQNHWGLYRTDDGGASWQDIANGVPSDFGFGMAVHPHRPDTAYIVPLESDAFRCVPEGRLRVYRTDDAGASWRALERGLPQEGAFECVLRDALATDTSDPAGVYFGTRSGKVFGSPDDGDTWETIADGLPPVVCVKAAVA